MSKHLDRSYRLTADLVAAYAGGPVVCLALAGVGRAWRLHAERPTYVRSRDSIRRAEALGVDGEPIGGAPEATGPAVARVSIRGPLEQRAGYHDPCAGYSDGYDAIADRVIAAMADGDILLVIDSPGGAVLGLFECVDRILRAKADMGRRVTVAVDGMAGSAGYCLAATLADEGELYVTRASMAGSIGARAAHVSEAGALKQAGLEVTEFEYPPGKTALSSARPLDETGRSRANRDIMIAFEAFASAVTKARPALTRKAIVKLGADMLTGAAAVAAGLADAVASIEDVETWALARAGGEDMPDDEKEAKRAEEEGPPSSKKPTEGRAEGDDDKDVMSCKRCGEEPGEGARYCAKCGAKVAAEDETPPSSKKPEARASRGTGSLYASMSLPALKAAAMDMHRKLDRVASIVGARTHAEVEGALEGVARDATKAKRYREERNAERARADARERIDILRSLADAGIHPRGELLVDIVGDDDKVSGVKPAALWGDGPEGRTLANLRGYARTRLDGIPPNERSPFEKAPREPDPERAKEGPNKAAADAAKANPVVQSAARSGVPIDDAAAIYAREFGGVS